MSSGEAIAGPEPSPRNESNEGVLILALPFSSCVTLSKLPNLTAL